MNEPTLDPAALERLRRLGGDPFAAEMIDLFVSYAEKKIVEAREAQAAGNTEGVGNAVHPIKSSAGNVGALQVQELAARIEYAAHEGQFEPLPGLVAKLELAFISARLQLEATKQTLARKL